MWIHDGESWVFYENEKPPRNYWQLYDGIWVYVPLDLYELDGAVETATATVPSTRIGTGLPEIDLRDYGFLHHQKHNPLDESLLFQ